VMKECVIEFNKQSEVVLMEVEASIDPLYASNLSGILSNEEYSSLKYLMAR
jgi:hypothetical protein